MINASSWANSHPGGVLAILHFVGRDATNEVLGYHSETALRRIEKYAIGRVELDLEKGWKPLTPPITLGLVRHSDGQRGHWKREGQLRLEAPTVDHKREKTRSMDSKAANDVLYLELEQLEPVQTSLDRRKEHARDVAYRELKVKLEAAGMFERPGPLAGYGADIVRYCLLGISAFGLYY